MLESVGAIPIIKTCLIHNRRNKVMSDNNSLNGSSRNITEEKTVRRKRRTERNKMRTINHISKLLDIFQDTLVRGYSDESWNELAGTLRQLSSFLSPEEYDSLSVTWRNAWTREPVPGDVVAITEIIKSRVRENVK